ncbi:hypothetical protein HORIV_10960 [Vreelandella olivaria]|uniref:Uncharacterized protein n=1 Tax=Vreelandella olivaria TaxID=390919 RepID=A0ABM7GDS4_9GAMM|nr:hypothetical protein HORIV_10960 [Halomonas olivaria]
MPSETSLKNLDLTLLAQRLGRLCKQLGVEVTAAESCTGAALPALLPPLREALLTLRPAM